MVEVASGPPQKPLAVLFLIFNRPDTTARVFEAIRKVQPTHLYVAADGARSGHPTDAYRCRQARRIVDAVDWHCTVKTLFRTENLGLRKAISGGITWFFENESEGIILEDDCLPDPSFFGYCQELLARYREDQRILVVGAQHFAGPAHRVASSYFFSRYGHCWGWASWRRAWRHHDDSMSAWPSLRNTDWLLGIGDGSRRFQRYWTGIFDQAYAGAANSWAYSWVFNAWTQNALAILPAKNLVTNIGFGNLATNTVNKTDVAGNLPLESLRLPLRHPPCIVRDFTSDAWTDRHIYGISLEQSILRRLQRIPGYTQLRDLARTLRSKMASGR